MPAKSPKVIVVGAGPIGLFTSFVLASAGCDVNLLDDGKRGTGWASGGMLGAAYEVLGSIYVFEDYKLFAQNSQTLWSRFLETIDVPIVPGSLFLARTQDEVDNLTAVAMSLAGRDFPIEPCAVPASQNAKQAWFTPLDIAFNPRQMLAILRQECCRAGVTVVEGRAQHVETGRVVLDDNRILEADQIIVTTGIAGRALAHCIPELSHLTPVKGQMFAIAGSGVVLDHVLRAGRCYLLPRDNLVVVGATSVHDDQDADEIDVDLSNALLAEALTLCPSLAGGQVVESWAGLRPMTPDGLPLLGYGQKEGVIIATGTYRNGWLLAAGIANAVKGLVLDEKDTTANLQSLSPLRFPN